MHTRTLTKTSLQQKPFKVVNLSNTNIRQTIPELVKDISCCTNCQFVELLSIFAQKIDKLRIQRNSLKDKYIQDIYLLEKQVSELRKENIQLQSTLKKYHKYQLEIKNLGNLEDQSVQFIQVLEEDIGVLLTNRTASEVQQTNLLEQEEQEHPLREVEQNSTKRTEIDDNYIENINKMALRYNISSEQLENMVNEYLQKERQELGKSGQKKDTKQHSKLKKFQRKLIEDREKQDIRKQLEMEIKTNSKNSGRLQSKSDSGNRRYR